MLLVLPVFCPPGLPVLTVRTKQRSINTKNAQKYPRKNEKIGEYYEFAL